MAQTRNSELFRLVKINFRVKDVFIDLKKIKYKNQVVSIQMITMYGIHKRIDNR